MQGDKLCANVGMGRKQVGTQCDGKQSGTGRVGPETVGTRTPHRTAGGRTSGTETNKRRGRELAVRNEKSHGSSRCRAVYAYRSCTDHISRHIPLNVLLGAKWNSDLPTYIMEGDMGYLESTFSFSIFSNFFVLRTLMYY